MKAFLTTVLVIGLITIAGFTFAKTTTIPSETVKSSQAQSGEIQKEYAGMVVNTDAGVTLMAGDYAYLLKSEKGEKLEAMVGKMVKVNGKLIKGDLASTILVAKIEETK